MMGQAELERKIEDKPRKFPTIVELLGAEEGEYSNQDIIDTLGDYSARGANIGSFIEVGILIETSDFSIEELQKVYNHMKRGYEKQKKFKANLSAREYLGAMNWLEMHMKQVA